MFNLRLVTQKLVEVRICVFMQTCIDQRILKELKRDLLGQCGEAGVHALKLVEKEADPDKERAPLLTQRIESYCAVFHRQLPPVLGRVKNPKNVT